MPHKTRIALAALLAPVIASLFILAGSTLSTPARAEGSALQLRQVQALERIANELSRTRQAIERLK